MDWMLASVGASVVVLGGPLLMVEAAASPHRRPNLRRAYWRLWIATGGVAACVGTWFFIDRAAVAAGQRSLVVSGVLVSGFAFLLGVFAAPFFGTPPLETAASASLEATRRVPLFGARVDYLMALLSLGVLVTLALSPNDAGYRLKAGAMIGGGIALYFMGRPRARWTLVTCLASAALTLLFDWQAPWQRRFVLASQLAVGVVGFVWCARLLVPQSRQPRRSRGGV